MNKRIKISIISLMLLPMIITSCGTKSSLNNESNNLSNNIEILQKEEKNEFNNLLGEINYSRKEVYKNPPVIKEEYINWFKEGDEEFSQEEVKEIIEYSSSFVSGNIILNPESQYDDNKILTYNDVETDVDRLFKLFRYAYGPYGYFGGDEVFNNAKASIIMDLQGKDEISSGDFYKVILDNLTFIEDAHFRINSAVPDASKFNVYFIGEDEFLKDSNGYYKIVDENKYYIKEINGSSDVENLMRISVNNDGKLIYRIGEFRNSGMSKAINISITYSCKEDIIEEKTYLEVARAINRNRVDKFEYRMINDIPIAKVGAMSDTMQVQDAQERFMNSAKEMKKYPISILDLRGNEGGFRRAGESWIDEFSGFIRRVDPATAYVNSTITTGNIYAVPFLEPRKEATVPDRIPNDKLVFVLIDSHNGSAGEWFVEDLMNMDNVVLVGTNTMGCKLNNSAHYLLNNSKIDITLGDMLSLSPYGEDFEFKGFQPDILVESDDALESVLKIIDYYNLK